MNNTPSPQSGQSLQRWYAAKLAIALLFTAFISALGALGYLFGKDTDFEEMALSQLNFKLPIPILDKPVESPPLDPFREAVARANSATALLASAQTKQEWEKIAGYWKEARALMKAVPPVATNRWIAAQKVVEYQRYLDYAIAQVKSAPSAITLKTTIQGNITPRSIAHSGNGLFFAQNMMFRHSITVYDREFRLVKTLSDAVNLSKYGYKKYQGTYRGSPVEAAFSHGGKYAWVVNYQMYGTGFRRPGSVRCSPAEVRDPSFLYRINTDTLNIDRVIQVGAVPKFVAASPDSRLVLISNWCSWDLSVIDANKNVQIRRIKLGRYPRGIAVDANSKNAYVAVTGSSDIARVNLQNFSVRWLRNIGRSPRYLNLDPQGRYLYAILNNENRVAKIDLSTGKVLNKVVTGNAPRSMAISPDGNFLYVVNYRSNTMSKVRARDMKVMQTVGVNSRPIDITYDSQTRQVWVACYSGSIQVFDD